MKRFWFWVTAAVLVAAGCSSLQQLAALRQVGFALAGVSGGRLAGVDIGKIVSGTKLSMLDYGKLTVALARQDVPLDFLVNVEALNPAENKVTAKMIRMGWALYLNDKETINGVVDTAVVMEPGKPVIMPMRMRVNLVQFFNGPAQDMVDLAAAVAGLNPDPTKISLKASPTIETPLGPLAYPNPITIVSRTIR